MFNSTLYTPNGETMLNWKLDGKDWRFFIGNRNPAERLVNFTVLIIRYQAIAEKEGTQYFSRKSLKEINVTDKIHFVSWVGEVLTINWNSEISINDLKDNNIIHNMKYFLVGKHYDVYVSTSFSKSSYYKIKEIESKYIWVSLDLFSSYFDSIHWRFYRLGYKISDSIYSWNLTEDVDSLLKITKREDEYYERLLNRHFEQAQNNNFQIVKKTIEAMEWWSNPLLDSDTIKSNSDIDETILDGYFEELSESEIEEWRTNYFENSLAYINSLTDEEITEHSWNGDYQDISDNSDSKIEDMDNLVYN